MEEGPHDQEQDERRARRKEIVRAMAIIPDDDMDLNDGHNVLLDLLDDMTCV